MAWASVGCRLPLEGFIRRYQLEVAISFRAERPSDNSRYKAQPFKRERLGRYCRRAEQGSRRGRVVETCPRQHKRRCSIEAAKRVWLIRPVEAARSIGVTLGMMLGPVVVGYDVIEPIMSKGAIGRGCFQMA